jgi:hypothetical protein
VSLADSFELFFEEDSGGVVVEIWETAVTAEGDEVVASVSVESL